MNIQNAETKGETMSSLRLHQAVSEGKEVCSRCYGIAEFNSPFAFEAEKKTYPFLKGVEGCGRQKCFLCECETRELYKLNKL